MDGPQVSDAWKRGKPYEKYVGRWSRQVAPLFLAWLGVPAGQKWLDVGCGTGALSVAILEQASPSNVVGVEPSEGFLEVARENLSGRAQLHQGNATAIPLEDSSVDVVVSGLVLNFVPDSHAALTEMARITRDGGTIGAYVWDYAGKMDLMRIFWDTAVTIDPDAAKLDEGIRFSSCNPDALENLFINAGLGRVEVTALDIEMTFANFDDYWLPFLGGQGTAPTYVMSLEKTARDRLREHIRQRIEIQGNGSIALSARAWAIRGSVTK